MCLTGGCGACIVTLKGIHSAKKQATTWAVNSVWIKNKGRRLWILIVFISKTYFRSVYKTFIHVMAWILSLSRVLEVKKRNAQDTAAIGRLQRNTVRLL